MARHRGPVPRVRRPVLQERRRPRQPPEPLLHRLLPARDAAIAIQREVLTGSRAKPPAELATLLPELMWLAQMGLVLYWVFDSSPDTERTRRLAVRGRG
ncbi:hypothetical protein ACFQVA_14235 [Actinomadura keratinilytica]